MLRMIIVLVGLVLISSSIASAGLAPEIGVSAVKCWTKNEQLKHPYGFEMHLLQPVSQKVKLVFEYEYLTSSTKTIDAYHWGHWGDSLGSVMDELQLRNSVSSFQFGFRHTLSHTRTTFLEFGGGICFVRLATHGHLPALGIDWNRGAAYKMGLVVDVSLLVNQLINLPLVMRFGFKHRFLQEEAETLPSSGSYAFGDAITTTEISWGFGYQFGR